MRGNFNGPAVNEPSLVRLYMELTGASESRARNVFMYVCCQEPGEPGLSSQSEMNGVLSEQSVTDSLLREYRELSGWLKMGVVVPSELN